ncbi:MAG: restriction endonuclease subunit R [Verrucomicrobia bacterium]|nr:restriction endonuclease subunit R [Verrucomicrobiota bacterium]
MNVTLKDYQQRVLDSLREYLRESVRTKSPRDTFEKMVKRSDGTFQQYFPVPMPELSGLPYVCLRVPTGGGKTLLASHAVGIAQKDFAQVDRSLVLWLVPSNTILDQTAKALSDNRHAYRRALEIGVGGPVEVLTIDEALRMSRATADGQTVVIVATIQSFRVEDTAGRKVYEDNGHLQAHFDGWPDAVLADLEKGSDGKPVRSLANVLRLRRPIVIVDEAHSARAELSFVTLARLRPACIVEFTATPATIYKPLEGRYPSNVLHRTSAAELKKAAMIKLPIRVFTRPPSQREQALAEAVTLRADLEKLALAEGQATGEYIRPILLIQAERVDDAEPLREQMVNDFKLPKDEIKISTGALDELKDIKDIAAANCPVRFIITVQKLKEGWDCPFAYVLCSLKETRSATAIEQIVGRVLRLPNVEFKQRAELNHAYVFSVSDSLPAVLAEFQQALEANGFTRAEAEEIVIPAATPSLALGSQPRTVSLDPKKDFDAALVKTNAPVLMGKVTFDTTTGDVKVLAPLTEDEKQALYVCFRTDTARQKAEAAVNEVAAIAEAFGAGKPRPATGYEKQESFIVPLLALRQGSLLWELGKTDLLERDWKLSEKDATLGDVEYSSKRPTGRLASLDVDDSGKVKANEVHETGTEDFVGKLHQQVWAIASDQNWTDEDLIQWLDQHIEHNDITAAESAVFLRKVIQGLKASRGLADVSALVLDRHRLRDAIARKIEQHRQAEHKIAFQELLGGALVVSAEKAVEFSKIIYDPSSWYEGGFEFKKHYFGKPGELKSSGEEYECAVFLDNLTEVKYWIRNLAKRPDSFRLQTATDYFYPDFLCLLQDGRRLVVEYKGKDRYDGIDAQEKRDVGAVWEGRSNGKCLFVMPTERNWAVICSKIGT